MADKKKKADKSASAKRTATGAGKMRARGGARKPAKPVAKSTATGGAKKPVNVAAKTALRANARAATGATVKLLPLTDGSDAAIRRLAELAARGRGPRGVEEKVLEILAAVRSGGDAAVARLTKKFDGVALAPAQFEVSKAEIAAATARVPEDMIAALKLAHDRICAFHLREVETGFERRENGISTGVRVAPLARAGVYVPGGKAAYPSSVLMNVVPAKVAGVGDITVVTPPSPAGIRDEVLAAASIAGATRVLRVGGAQAVAALAYGTETIARVDKIVGPGNIFVATAKRLVFGEVDIDMVAGPSEVLIIADDSANPEWVAADMLAQAEHDELAASICITTSRALAGQIARALARQCAELSRAAIAARSLERYGTILIAASIERACELSDQIAPEHLEVATRRPRTLLPRLRNAGAIFLGGLTTEPIGDYTAGPNHVLPTGGSARFASPLGVYDFIKRTSIIEVDRKGFERLADVTVALANAEGLQAHAMAVLKRRK